MSLSLTKMTEMAPKIINIPAKRIEYIGSPLKKYCSNQPPKTPLIICGIVMDILNKPINIPILLAGMLLANIA